MRHLALIGVMALGLRGKTAFAAPADKPGAHSAISSENLKKALESGDEARAGAALDEIGRTGDRSTAPLVEDVLNRGASPTLLLKAIAVAGALGRESSSASLAPYVKHRGAEVRRAAAHSLVRTKGPAAVQALRDALRSNDAPLRGTAASGLGALGAKEAVPELFAVLPKEVPEAAAAIGTLCSADDCKKFLALLGKLPFELMQSGFLPILLRTGSDVPDSLKLDLIEQLRRMATPKSAEVMTTALAAYPADASPKVKVALDAALHGHNVKSGEP